MAEETLRMSENDNNTIDRPVSDKELDTLVSRSIDDLDAERPAGEKMTDAERARIGGLMKSVLIPTYKGSVDTIDPGIESNMREIAGILSSKGLQSYKRWTRLVEILENRAQTAKSLKDFLR